MEHNLTIRRFKKDTADTKRLFEIYRFRWEQYCKRFGWVQPPYPQLEMEIDPFDEHVFFHYGIYDEEDRLIAYQRIIRYPSPFMYDYAYDGLSRGVKLDLGPQAAEVSRLVVDPIWQKKALSRDFKGHNVTAMVYRESYRICKEEGIRDLYLATTQGIIATGKVRGFPFDLICEKALSNGDVIQLVKLNWKRFEDENLIHRPEMLNWYQLRDQIDHGGRKIDQAQIEGLGATVRKVG